MPPNAYVATLTRSRVQVVIHVRPTLLGAADRHHAAGFNLGIGRWALSKQS